MAKQNLMKIWYFTEVKKESELLIIQKIAFHRGIYWWPNRHRSEEGKQFKSITELQKYAWATKKKFIQLRRHVIDEENQALLEHIGEGIERTQPEPLIPHKVVKIGIKEFINQICQVNPIRFE